MLNSIILSLAISVTPTPIADTHNLDTLEIGKVRDSLRINAEDDLNIERVGQRRGTLRINAEDDLSIERVGQRRGTLRI
jgi:hypothetical protein